MSDLVRARTAGRSISDRPTPRPRAPRFEGRTAASPRATKAARGASRKRDTRCELALRRALHRLGLRYRIDAGDLPGRPDIVFRRKRLVVFCDGDFWHGRDLEARLRRLERGHNASYWTAKILRNVQRDREHDRQLEAAGWHVLRLWETSVLRDAEGVAERVQSLLKTRLPG